ncbi:AMP-binding protein [Sphingomonas sp. AOB5]|uniref:class I adenylate-forming enzyme family protein n=1 Tax=Sphingomonas sp. AOB5 TaxID=3034017 RepID=UPI0023F74EE1|nr:AMP-binding protein [Sphingomonas sp. AOB5]MDF7774860.1 AMP-binding protein [Sphingomonas sp. AOB5]
MLTLNGHQVEHATIRDILRHRASLGDRTYAVVDGVSLSFAEADERANRIGNRMAELGVVAGDVVITYMHNSIDHVCAWFGSAKIGAVWSPVNIALVNLDLLYTIRNAAPKAVVIDAELLPNYLQIRDQIGIEGLVEIVRGPSDAGVGETFESLLTGSSVEPDAQVSPYAPAAIIYTGGSTGMPKGVVVSSLWFVVAALRYAEMFDVREDDSHMGVGQLCHAIGSSIDIFAPLYWGIQTAVPRWFSASRFWETAREQKATIVGCLVGPLIAMLCSRPESDDDRNHTLRVSSSGTAQVPIATVQEFERRFGITLLEIYGQTESGPLGAVGQRRSDKPGYSQGRTNGWCEVAIGDPDDQLVPANVQGEILIRPTIPGTFLLGYHGQPDKFADACRNFWFHTGDIGLIDEDGFLHLKGRFAHLIRHRGENISVFELEQTILLHPAIKECAAVGVPSPIGDEDVKVLIQFEDGQTLAPEEIIAFCLDRIAYFKVPRYIEVVDGMPRSAVKNEIERHKLRDQGVGDAWDREAAGISVKKVRA